MQFTTKQMLNYYPFHILMLGFLILSCPKSFGRNPRHSSHDSDSSQNQQIKRYVVSNTTEPTTDETTIRVLPRVLLQENPVNGATVTVYQIIPNEEPRLLGTYTTGTDGVTTGDRKLTLPVGARLFIEAASERSRGVIARGVIAWSVVRGEDISWDLPRDGAVVRIGGSVILSGTVVNQRTGARVGGVTVQLASTIPGLDIKRTDADGHFSYTVPRGMYQVRINTPGYRQFSSNWIDVETNRNETIRLQQLQRE